MSLTNEELDGVYFAICDGVAAAGPDRAPQYLARLALLLAIDVGCADQVLRRVAESGLAAATPDAEQLSSARPSSSGPATPATSQSPIDSDTGTD